MPFGLQADTSKGKLRDSNGFTRIYYLDMNFWASAVEMGKFIPIRAKKDGEIISIDRNIDYQSPCHFDGYAHGYSCY
jgi:hypothetical protein